MKHSPPLDGLRALAVAGVVIFHVSEAWCPGGFAGVDMFFTLSGYLITSLIAYDFELGRFSLREFYLRRIRRLIPNLVATITATGLAAYVLLPHSNFLQVCQHSVWALLHASNIYVWRFLGGYWGNSAESAPLTHTWSLAVEEQFYLVFPLGLLLLLRRQSGNKIAHWVLAGTVAGFLLCLLGTSVRPGATFYLLPTRVWELLAGATLALYSRAFRRSHGGITPAGNRVAAASGWLGIASTGASLFLLNEKVPFPGFAALLPVSASILLLWSSTDETSFTSRLLGSKCLVAIGKASYSIYLWHWPCITLCRAWAELHGVTQLQASIAGGLIGLALALAAYRAVESPLRTGLIRPKLRYGIIGLGYTLATAGFIAVLRQAPHGTRDGNFSVVRFSGGAYDATVRPLGIPANSIVFSDVVFQKKTAELGDWRRGGIIKEYGAPTPSIVVFGSSHALMYSPVIDRLCREMGTTVAFLGVDYGGPALLEATHDPSYTGPFASPAEAREFDLVRLNLLREWRPKLLFLIDRWDIRGPLPSFEAKLKTFLSQAGPLVERIAFVTQIPVHRGGDRYNLRELVAHRTTHNRALPRMYPDAAEALRESVASSAESLTKQFPKLSVVRIHSLFYNADGSIRYLMDRDYLYADDDHLSDSGAELAQHEFRVQLSHAIGKPGHTPELQH